MKLNLSPLKLGLMIGSGALALAGALLDSKRDQIEVQETARDETRKYLDEMFKSSNQPAAGDTAEDGEP